MSHIPAKPLSQNKVTPTFRSVDEETDAVGQPHGGRDLVGEVDVARSVEDVQQEGLALDVLHQETHRHRLDRDATLLNIKTFLKQKILNATNWKFIRF